MHYINYIKHKTVNKGNKVLQKKAQNKLTQQSNKLYKKS